MKKIFIFNLLLFISLSLLADGWETFINFPETGSSYEDGTFPGQDGSLWTYWQCRGDQLISDETPCLGKNRVPTAEVSSGLIPGGISSFNFDFKQAFSTNVELEVYINDIWVATVTTNNEQGIVKNSGDIDVNIEEDFVFKFIQASNTSGQVSIDNISWISFGGTPEPEPTNYPTDFTATAHGLSIQLDWTDSQGEQLPAGYLIKANITDDIELPVDGIPESDDTDLSDGEARKNISFGTETYTFTNLLPDTAYYFEIFPYTNPGANIDYKTNDDPPVDTARTQNNINSEDFEDGTFGSWNTFNVASNKNWEVFDFGGALNSIYFARMNGLEEDELSNDWLISPSMNFDLYSDMQISFYTQWEFGDTDDELKLKYSTDYVTGDPLAATWNDLVFDKPAFEDIWGHSGYIDLSMISSTNIHIAFQYLSSGNPRRWDVDEIQITGHLLEFVPSITVIRPVDDDQWFQGTIEDILWTAANTEDSVKIEITADASGGSPEWIILATGLDANAEIWNWNIPEDQPVGDDYQIRISDYATRTFGLSGIFSILEPPYIPQIVINEIMYHPSPDLGAEEDYEYVELYNNDTLFVDLSGWYFSEGFEFSFPDATGLQPDSFLVVARNPDSVILHYNINNVTGPFASGELSNSGEDIELKTSDHWSVDYVDYGDGGEWPEEPDGNGPSLELIEPFLDNSLAENWAASIVENGTPGLINSVVPPEIITVIIPNGGEVWIQGRSEEIVWTSENYEGAVRIELMNQARSRTVLVDSTDNDGFWLWDIPIDQLPGSDYIIKISDEEDGEPFDQSDTTFSIIPPPIPPDLVITEIMYNPPETGADSLEFIEIYNNDTLQIDLGGYYFSNGVSFSFPQVNLSSGDFILVADDSLAIQNTFGIASYQWEGEGLSNSGELIQLNDPYDQTVDSVDYGDGPPWPAEPDGEGPSLTFCDPDLDNSIPDFWIASTEVAAINQDGDTLFATPGSGCYSVVDDIVITELFYNPPGTESDSLEFIEIYNNGSGTVSLDGCYFSQGIEFAFPDVEMDAGDYIVITKNIDLFLQVFGYPAYEWTGGDLSDEGEIVELNDGGDNTVDVAQYSSVLPWDTLANGYGPSLTLCEPSSDNMLPENWTASTEYAAVTSQGDTIWATPYDGCAQGPIADFYASDTVILAGNTIDFTDASTGDPETWAWSFQGGEPDTSNLQNPLGIIYNIGGVYNVTLTISKQGDINSKTKTEYITVLDTTYYDLVITEIMYNPPETGTDSLEFIEIFNNDDININLEGYHFTQGVDFAFPEIELQPGEFLVVAADSIAIKNTFGLDVLQWDDGTLNDDGESIEIKDAYNIVQDYVEYDNQIPWPEIPNGEGPSLTFCNPDLNNNLGEFWSASLKYAAVNAAGDSIFASPGASCLMSPPVANFIASDTAIAPGGVVEFTDISTGVPLSWNWTFEGGTPETSTARYPVISYNSAGDFDVSLKVVNLFGTDSITKSEYIHVAVTVENNLFEQGEISVYPNPSNGKISVVSDFEYLEYEIYSIIGDRIHTGILRSSNARIEMPLSLKGIYFIRFVSPENGIITTKKLIIDQVSTF